MCPAPELDNVRQRLGDVAERFDVASVPADRVVTLFEVLDAIERSATALKTLLAARVEACGHWQAAGYASAEEFVAATSGSTVVEARAMLATSAQLAELPVVEHALRSGTLSGAQTTLVTDAAAAAPGQQARLVAHAQQASVRELKGECLRTKAAADPDLDATHRRIHARRHWRSFVDAEGAWNVVGRTTADTGARIEALMRPFVDDEFARARTDGRRESYDTYTFDAFVRMLERAGAGGQGDAGDASTTVKRPPLRSLAILRVDLEALVREVVKDGETCEIAGVGPVPVSVARRMLGESILKLVLTKGDAVCNVTHLGRGPTMAQRVALLWSQPLCTVEGCYRTRCDIDHAKPWADTRHTRLTELDHLCRCHHDKKTYEGWALAHGTGKRALVPPEDPRHPRNRPPP